MYESRKTNKFGSCITQFNVFLDLRFNIFLKMDQSQKHIQIHEPKETEFQFLLFHSLWQRKYIRLELREQHSPLENTTINTKGQKQKSMSRIKR